LSSVLEFGVQSDEFEALAQRQLEIGGALDRQSVLACEVEEPRFVGLSICLDREVAQCGQKGIAALTRDATAPLVHDQDIPDLEEKQRGSLRPVPAHLLQRFARFRAVLSVSAQRAASEASSTIGIASTFAPLVPSAQNLVDGNALRSRPKGADGLDSAVDFGLSDLFLRDYAGNRPAMASGEDCLTALHGAQQLRQTGLCVRGLNFAHFELNRPFVSTS
jgi:hypothetical protein